MIYLRKMCGRHFKYFLLLLFGLFFSSVEEATACGMHQSSAQKTIEHHSKKEAETQREEKKDCCADASSGHHSKGHCDHKDCTNNICHPVSIFSLHTEDNISLLPLPKAVTKYIVGKHDMQLYAYSYSIWQPPRLG